MRGFRISSGWGVVLLGVGLFTAFVLGDFIPGMVFAGWIMAFTGMMSISGGDPAPPEGNDAPS